MNLSQWLLFEERLRKAANLEALQLIVVNLLQHVFPYYQAILFQTRLSRNKVVLASNVSQIDDNAQTVIWLNKTFLPWLTSNRNEGGYIPLTECPLTIDDSYQNMDGSLYIPLSLTTKKSWGLLFWLEAEPDPSLINLLPIINSAITHAWEKITYKREVKPVHTAWHKYQAYIIGGASLLFLFLILFPVHQYTLVPADISPQNPVLISPSINGTIQQIKVEPNQLVKKDQLLFILDDISIRNKLDEANEGLNVAKEKYLKAYKHAFSDNQSLYDINMLKGEVEKAQVTQQYYQALLERTQVTAPKSGVVLYSDPKNWLGKPIVVGEKVMLLASPNSQEINFWVPIDSMLDVDLSVPVKFFPNENPTLTVQAKLDYVNPIAEAQPDGTLSYFGVAEIEKKAELRLGQKGILKIYGKKISLIHYIFNKPLRYIRQHLGI